MSAEPRTAPASDSVTRLSITEFFVTYGQPGFNATLPDGLRKCDDLSGLIFGKLLVVEPVTASVNFFGPRYHCRCACAGQREVWAKHLLKGIIHDCGCRKRERTRKKRQRAKARRKALKAAMTMKKLHGTNHENL